MSTSKFPERHERVQGHSFRFIASDNSLISNKKPFILFFHGFSFSLDDWRKTGTLERVQSLGYPFVALDLPSGKASKSDHISYEKVADCIPIIDEFLEKIDAFAAGKTIIIGPSMGGGFALVYAIAHPEKVAGLVLVSPSLNSIEEQELENLETPTMLVWGERDNVFPLEEYGKQLKNTLPHAKLVIIKGAGHAAYLDKHEEFNELLSDFLEELA